MKPKNQLLTTTEYLNQSIQMHHRNHAAKGHPHTEEEDQEITSWDHADLLPEIGDWGFDQDPKIIMMYQEKIEIDLDQELGREIDQDLGVGQGPNHYQ